MDLSVDVAVDDCQQQGGQQHCDEGGGKGSKEGRD